MPYDLKEICSHFDITTNIGSYGNGHINDTYLCETDPGFILQRINTNIFKNPDELMENIFNVTDHIKAKIKAAGGDIKRETLTVIKTTDNKNYYRTGDGDCFRMYNFIQNSASFDTAETSDLLYEAGKAFGKFQRMLDDFPADILHETIANFHNTPERVNQLKSAIKNDAAGRLSSLKAETDFAFDYSRYADMITSALKSGEVPLRVTHNDTKLNNVLFDADTLEGLCVIDLDTVMPGSMLYDFGDALRFGASSASEDETELDKVWFDLEKFDAFSKGFLGETAKFLSLKELELLAYSPLILTYECAIRFLADYLNGDTYFKIHKPLHNLHRARNQFKLVKDIESKLPKIKEIINKYL